MKRTEPTADPRVKQGYFLFPAYLALVAVLAVLIAMPPLILGGIELLNYSSAPYAKAYLLYCVVLAALICGLMAWQKHHFYDRPLKKLSQAARQVAQGDFSVYLAIRHAPDNVDEIDVLYRDFNTMVEELGSIETLKNDFAANVSHELKTPLAAIQNYAQLLETTPLTGEQAEYVAAIQGSTRRLASLVFNILKLNKLDNQKIQPKPAPYDLCRQLVDCALGFESIWEQKGIEFDADIEERAVVEVDEELMALVWNNLLSNAFKFTPAGGTVTLRQYTQEDYITVEVSDTGCGMEHQVLRHIFDKFYQGDPSHATEGNGLGLALVQRVLQLSGGTITVDSAQGVGTTFTVLLPKHRNKETERT